MMGRMSRDTYHHGDLKAVILAKAAILVAERGADGISLRELAREAGVSHAAPAHHFTDRRGLFTALAAWSLVHGFAMLRLNEAIDTDDDPMVAVEKIALMLFDG